MENSIIAPLRYFEYLLDSNEISRLKDDYIKRAVEEFINIENIDTEKGIITYRDINSTTGQASISFEKYFTDVLYSEFQSSKLLIDDYVVNNPDNFLPFLYLQEKTLQYLINKGKDYITIFPVILKPILGIQSYINRKYLYDQERKINMNLSDIHGIEVSSLIYNDDYVISEITSFFKGNNDIRQQIMSEEDYEYVIGIIKQYNEANEIPQIARKISVPNISKNLLSFTFWVLHKHLYSTRPIRENFLHLVKNLFTDFDDWEFSTFRKKFGSKNKVTYRGVRFLPEIIKQELARD